MKLPLTVLPFLLVPLCVEASDCTVCADSWSSISCESEECSIKLCSAALFSGLDSSDCEEYLEDLEDKATGGWGISIAALILVIWCLVLAAGLSYYVVIEQQKKIQQLMDRLSLVVPSWKNVSGAKIRCRTEPDMEKMADRTIDARGTVFGVEEGEWLKTVAGLYLPMKHPTTGAPLFSVVSQHPNSEPAKDAIAGAGSWKNVSGAQIRCRTEPDMEKMADKTIDVGETVDGVVEGEWLKTDDGLYVPAKHPKTGAPMFTATQQAPTSEDTNDPTGI